MDAVEKAIFGDVVKFDLNKIVDLNGKIFQNTKIDKNAKWIFIIIFIMIKIIYFICSFVILPFISKLKLFIIRLNFFFVWFDFFIIQ